MRAKRILSLFMAMLSILVVCSFSSCGDGIAKNAPKAEELRARVEELLAAAVPVNEIFYGEGLPVYAHDSDYAKEHGIYTDDTGYEHYDVVKLECPYHSISELKELAETVYSADYLKGVYEVMFDGVMGAEEGTMVYARYIDRKGDLFMCNFTGYDLLPGKRVWDVSTLTVVGPSTANDVHIRMNSWLEGKEDETKTYTLELVKQNGVWLLNNPSY